MDARFETLTQQLFKKSFADCTLRECYDLVEKAPYFAPAHFLLLKKMDPNSEEYRKQYQKAILYYHQPPNFDAFLFPEKYRTDFAEEELIQEKEEAIWEERSEEVVEEVGSSVSVGVGLEKEIPDPEIENIEINKAEVVQEETILNPPETPVEEKRPDPVIIPADLKNEVSAADTRLAFEPYHTVDYFASQGIKLSQEEITKDKFGKQVKSFTEWLKTMKRLPAGEISKNIDRTVEKKVENLAAGSIQKADVVTEAMAEVWLHQGNREKAIDVYTKLSLQNPSKSAYFAAKIDQVKKIS